MNRVTTAKHGAHVTNRGSLAHWLLGLSPQRASSSACVRRWIGRASFPRLLSLTSISRIMTEVQPGGKAEHDAGIADQVDSELVEAGGARPGRQHTEVPGNAERLTHDGVSARARAGCVGGGEAGYSTNLQVAAALVAANMRASRAERGAA